MTVDSVALDANLLLLYTVGSFEPRTLRSYKRLSSFTANDLRFLQLALSRRKLVATPHLFTEVCNLANALPIATRQGFFDYLARFIPRCLEHTFLSEDIVRNPAFRLFGLTDAALALLARETLVITEDGRLRDYLLRSGLRATSLNGFRDAQSTSKTLDL